MGRKSKAKSFELLMSDVTTANGLALRNLGSNMGAAISTARSTRQVVCANVLCNNQLTKVQIEAGKRFCFACRSNE